MRIYIHTNICIHMNTYVYIYTKYGGASARALDPTARPAAPPLLWGSSPSWIQIYIYIYIHIYIHRIYIHIKDIYIYLYMYI